MSVDMSFLLRPTIYTASAGTGKTHRLTEDFRAALEHYGFENAHRLIAITFTENAAAEMRERIQKEMLKKQGLRALQAAQSLSISTIHSFCRRELKRHALRLGLDPEFDVLEETNSGGMARQVLLDVLGARYNSEDKRSKSVIPRCVAFTSYFRSSDFGASLEREILDDYNRLRAQGLRMFGQANVNLPPNEWDARLESLREAVNALVGIQPEIIKAEKSREKLLLVRDNLGKYLSELEHLKPGEQAARMLDRLCKPIKRNVSNDVKALFDDLLGAVRDCFHEMIRADTFGVMIEMLQILGELDGKLETEKRARRALGFADLELQMLRLLEQFPDVREEYRGRYNKVFVDEFQDTNPLQVRIIELLAEPRALYYVGDPKQSIFGWRYAEPKTIDVKRNEFGEGAKTLSQNWRSHPDILTFVNRLFGECGEPGELGFDYEMMTAAREFTGKIPDDAPMRVALFKFPGKEQGDRLNADERRLLQAQSAAAYIKDLVENKRLTHTRADSARINEPLTYGDFAILLRKNKTVPLFEQALSDANIPFVSETSVGFLGTAEISALIDFMQFLLTPENDLLCARVLRSDLVGVSSEGLAELAKARWDGNANRPLAEMFAGTKLTHPDDTAAIAEFTQFISALRPRIPQFSASAIISETVDKLRLREKLAAYGRPFRAALNINKLIDFGDGISGIGYAALEQAASSFREMGYQGANIGEMFVEGGEFVKIMTVHRAKGLDFPAVIAAGADYSLQDTRQLFFDERIETGDGTDSFRFAVKHRYERYAAAKEANIAYKEMKAEADGRTENEERRLLYVALTRAVEHLAVFGVQEGLGKLWQSVLPRALGEAFADVAETHLIKPLQEGERLTPIMPALSEIAESAKPKKVDENAAAAMLTEARMPVRAQLYQYLFGASEFLKWMRGGESAQPRHITDNDGELERGLAEWMASHETFDGEEGARELGTAIHDMLDFAVRHLEGAPPEGITDALLNEKLMEQWFAQHIEAVAQSRKRAEKLLRNFETGVLPELIREADAVRTEHAFMLRAAPDAGVFLRGRCDLMLSGKAGLCIIDYKTDRIGGKAQRDTLVEQYTPQLAMYCLGAQALYGGEPLTAGLALLDTGEVAWLDGLQEQMALIKVKMAEFAAFVMENTGKQAPAEL